MQSVLRPGRDPLATITRILAANNNLKIASKGLILALVPLCLALAFLASLTNLLDRAESDLEKETRARLTQTQAAHLGQLYFDAVSAITTYAFTRQEPYEQRYENVKTESSQTFAALTKMVQGHREQIERLEHLQMLQLRTFKLLDEMKKDPRDLAQMTSFVMVIGIREQMRGLVTQYMRELDVFCKAQAAIDGTATIDPNKSRRKVKHFIWFGAFAAVLIGWYLSSFFSRGITKRLNTVMDNAVRLAASQPLHPVLQGRDEIARLDTIFHKMAKALAEASRRERAMVDNALAVICSIDAGNRFKEVSPASLSIWGYSPEELIGKRIIDIMVAEDVDKFLSAQKQVADGQSTITLESRVSRKDSTAVDMLWSLHWSSEETTYFCVTHDITARKIAEDLLKESEARIRMIVESMPVALITSDADGIIETTNIRGEQMFGYRNQEIVGQHLAMLLGSEETAAPGSFMKMVSEKWLGRVGEVTALKKNGGEFSLELSISQFMDRSEDKLLTVALDVSERHALEKFKKEFVQMVSHDLRSPLTSIKCLLLLMSEGVYGKLDQQGLAMLQRSDTDIDRLVSLIDGLLDLEKLQAGKMQIEKSPVPMSSVIARSVSAVSYLADRKEIAIETQDESSDAYADGPKLVQVLVNLLSNALKFSPSASTIKVDCSDNDEFVEVRVSDQGRGIPADHITSIFDRFAQVEAADHREKGGKGLGLAICKSIVEAHGGAIGVESEEGKGSCFWFRIPQPNQS